MRKRVSEPTPAGPPGRCPAGFPKEVKKAWNYLVASCPPGVVTHMDRILLQQAAVMVAKFWADPMGFSLQNHYRLECMLARMGMTPADRSKVQVQKQPDAKPDSKFAQFRPAKTA